jgi:hypothetical protein
MLDPQHACYWTRKRQTDLFLLAGNHLTSAGVSPRVFLSALAEPDLTWYSRTRGDHNDDLDIVAATAEFNLEESLQQSNPTERLVAWYIGDLHPVTEYVLNDVVAERMGLSLDAEPESAVRYWLGRDLKGPPGGVRYLINSHDDCFTSVLFSDDGTVGRVLAQVLQVHSFYLQREFDWSSAIQPLVGLLKSHNAIRLRSHKAHGRYGSVVNIGLPKGGRTPGKQETPLKVSSFEMAGRIRFEGDVVRIEETK